MSRAFVKEDDEDRPEVLAEIQVSSAPNLVTARGRARSGPGLPRSRRRSTPIPTRRRPHG
jgi:hypothetical protein